MYCSLLENDKTIVHRCGAHSKRRGARNEVKTARVTMIVMKGIGHLVRRLRRSFSMAREGSVCSKIAGLGKFSSGFADLGFNKKHLQGFGQRGCQYAQNAC
jgi:hypothetical protein